MEVAPRNIVEQMFKMNAKILCLALQTISIIPNIDPKSAIHNIFSNPAIARFVIITAQPITTIRV